MNDDELNELLACHESEMAIFCELDVSRERDALEAWRQAGNRGKPPLPLIQLEELPECYQTDEPFDIKETEEAFEGRGQRRRNVVSYNDGLDDDTWAMVRITIHGFTCIQTLNVYTQALEEGEDIQELADRAREKKERRAQNKLLRDTEASGQNTPAFDSVDGRGRKPKKGKAKANNDYEPAAGSKRKRGPKSVSATPDIEDDEEDHESVSGEKSLICYMFYLDVSETAKDEDCCQSQQFWSRYTTCHTGENEESFHGMLQGSLSLRGREQQETLQIISRIARQARLPSLLPHHLSSHCHILRSLRLKVV
jgi:hypothetical protein